MITKPSPAPTFLDFDSLMPILPGDHIYYAAGSESLGTVDSKFSNTDTLSTTLATFEMLGELTESPGNLQSTVSKLRTRNHILPGKRSNSVTLTIAGMNQAQKDFLESPAFSETELSIILTSRDKTQAVLFNGLRWTFAWNAETDTITTGTLTGEITGNSSAIRIYPKILKPEIPELP